MPTEIERRRNAAQATLDHFRDRPFAWGRYDCAKMLAFHLRQYGRRIHLLAKAGSYSSAIGAKAALRRLGVESLPELLDLHLTRIPPAAAVIGDIVSGEGDDPLGTVGIVLGNGAILGYSEDAPGAGPLRSHAKHLDAAWRV